MFCPPQGLAAQPVMYTQPLYQSVAYPATRPPVEVSAKPLKKASSHGRSSRPTRVAKMSEAFLRHGIPSPAPEAEIKRIVDNVELKAGGLSFDHLPKAFDIVQRGSFPSISLVNGTLVIR